MDPRSFKDRTKKFAIGIIHLVEKLPKNQTAEIIGRQLIRSGTSVGANYRSACRARSRADFISRMTIVEEECDETMYWIELLDEQELVGKDEVATLLTEANEIISMVVASCRTARSNK